jgi:predicted nucleotidyltransferase
MDQRTRKITNRLKEELVRRALLPLISKIILFGSRARGDHDERSDLDIAIAMKKSDKVVWHQVLAVIDELPTLLKVDVINYTEASTALKSKIQQEGVIIYE